MSYRTILLHVDDRPRCAERMRVASDLAQAHEAHLIGLAGLGVTLVPYPGFGESVALYYDEAVKALGDRVQNAARTFEQTMTRAGLPSVESRTPPDDTHASLCMHARYADLLVLGQHDQSDPQPAVAADLPETVVLHSGRPVLIVPYAGAFPALGRNVLIAWNASREAARAVSDALPFLQRAADVRIVVFDPHGGFDGHGREPGADVATWLARHGIRPEVTRESGGNGGNGDVGNRLLSRAADFGSDLIVMGGYGHSRFRETLLGGVTRTILKHMTVPVLMSR
jgi:nucleotide-binding universal stress UspA family protein